MKIDWTSAFSENGGFSGEIFLTFDLWVAEYG